MDRRMRGMRGCCSYIPFVSIIGLALLLAGLALYGHEVRQASTLSQPGTPHLRPLAEILRAIWAL